MSQDNVSFEITSEGAVQIVALGGRLDAKAATGVREKLVALVTGPVKVVIDLGDLEWIDSSGVGSLITLYKRVRTAGGDIKVARLRNQPKEIFRLLRLESAFKVFDTVDEATASLAE